MSYSAHKKKQQKHHKSYQSTLRRLEFEESQSESSDNENSRTQLLK